MNNLEVSKSPKDWIFIPVVGKLSNVATLVPNVMTLLINFKQRRDVDAQHRDVSILQRDMTRYDVK